MSARLNDPRWLVGHWPVNGHPEDVSGHGNHLTWVGTLAYAENQHGIQVGSFGGSPYLRLVVADWRLEDSKGTITAWIKPNVVNIDQAIFASADESASTDWMRLMLTSSSKLVITQVGNGTDALEGDTVFVANRWYHVALVSDGSSYKMYVDGVVETLAIILGSNTGDWFADMPNRDNITIGALKRASLDTRFKGSIGDVRVYNVDLTQDEINKLRLQTAPRQVVAEQPLNALPDQTDATLAMGGLNAKTAGTLKQLGVTRTENYVVENSTPQFEKVGMKFNGTDDGIRIGSLQTTPLGFYPYTMMAWVKTTAGVNHLAVSYDDQGINSIYYGIGLRSTGEAWLTARNQAERNIVSPASYNDGGWHHIAGVFVGDTERLLFVDGELVITGTALVTQATNMDYISVGASLGFTDRYWFNGEIRDARAYKRLVSADEIKAIVLSSVPDLALVLNVMGDGLDRSSYRQVLVPQDDAIVGRRMKFDGADDYLHETVTDWRIGDSRGTICAWIKRASVSSEVVIFASSNLNGLNVVRFLSLSTGEIGIIQRANDSPDGVRGDTQLAADRWYHIAVTSDGTDWKLYVNGVEEALTLISGANTGDWFDAASRNNITIGAWRHAVTAAPYDGEIDDVRGYSDEKTVDWFKEYHLRTRKFY